jgi:hypothetical protein
VCGELCTSGVEHTAADADCALLVYVQLLGSLPESSYRLGTNFFDYNLSDIIDAYFA